MLQMIKVKVPKSLRTSASCNTDCFKAAFTVINRKITESMNQT